MVMFMFNIQLVLPFSIFYILQYCQFLLLMLQGFPIFSIPIFLFLAFSSFQLPYFVGLFLIHISAIRLSSARASYLSLTWSPWQPLFHFPILSSLLHLMILKYHIKFHQMPDCKQDKLVIRNKEIVYLAATFAILNIVIFMARFIIADS